MRFCPFYALTTDPLKSGQQNGRSRGRATFEVPVRLLRILERVFLIHRNLARPARHDLEQLIRGLEQVLAFGSVMVERRTGGKQRALGLQDIDIEGLDLSRGAAEAHEHAERLDAVERGREGRLANPVIDHLAELAAGDLLHLRSEILIAVENDMMGAVLLRKLALLLRADGPAHISTEVVRPLACDEADAAGSGMDEHIIAFLDLVCPAQQILRG